MTESGDARPPLPEDIFNDALELPPEQRAAFLAEACPDEHARELIEGMLRLVEADPSLRRPPVPQAVPPRLGKYELIEEAGRGGMGIVYTARDTQLGRLVALKLLPAALAADPRGRERFLREARLLAALSDERIATIHTLEEAEGIHFLTMEHIEGRTLACLMTDGPLPPALALDICRRIAQALAGAHARQIVHRDLKPSNVMVTPAGGVKILDFGIAKMLGAEAEAAAAGDAGSAGSPGDPAGDAAGTPPTAPAGVPGGAPPPTPAGPSLARGTPGYMAPEQRRGDPVDVRCDIWALGCVLYESLTGRCVADLADGQGRFALVGLPRSLPRPVRALLEACLEPEPARRMMTAARAAEILDGALDGLRARRRRRRLAALALLVVAMLLPATAIWQSHRGGPVAAVELAGPQRLRALDAAGHVIWTRTFPHAGIAVATADSLLRPALARGVSGRPSAVLVALGAGNWPTSLACLDPGDGSLRWTWDAVWQRPVNALGHLGIVMMQALPWPGRHAPAVALGLYDTGWYSAALQFLDEQGRSLGTYYHPGPFCCLQELPRSADEPIRYLAAGVNSSARFVRDLVPFATRVHCGFLAILVPPDVDGQAFPWSENLPEPRDWPGLPRAREAAYVAIPPLDPHTQASVSRVQVRRDGAGEVTIEAAVADGRYLFLDGTLEPVSCYVGLHSLADSLHVAGRLGSTRVMVIRDGRIGWREVPLTF